MKKFALVSFIMIASFLSVNTVYAGACKDAWKAAKANLKKDKKCVQYAGKIAVAYGEQLEKCGEFRRYLKDCSLAHRDKVRICKKTKRAARECTKLARQQCKHLRGKKRTQCFKAKNKSCKAKRREFRDCRRASSRVKRQCVSSARQTDIFINSCKPARLKTRKAVGTTLKCVGKHYGKAIGICVLEGIKKIFSKKK